MNLQTRFLRSLAILLIFAAAVFAGSDVEFQGQFDKALVPNVEDFERVILKFFPNDQIQHLKSFDESAHNATGRLYNPQTGKASLLVSIVEIEDQDPFLMADLNGDNTYQDNEKIVLKESEDSSYLWTATIDLPVKEGFFTSCPIFVRYFERVRTSKMTVDDRLLTQTTDVLARGSVDVKGKKVLVQYAYNFTDKKVSAKDSWQGVDSDENGEIDMDNLSPEAAKASEEETVVFRVGQTYLSTKKLDLAKNLIVMREHAAKDYKRAELHMGREFPDFDFTDFAGKKRKLSEFRGKYVLLDIWGIWCPACRDEVPYIRESFKRFQGRGLEVIGLNTDQQYTIGDIKLMLEKHDMKWTQARFDSIFDFIAVNLRINSFPSTFLIAPDGKILSMSRSDRDEPDLRGKDLVETLDEILPKTPSPSGN
jgi:peroxiredoxin